MGRLAFVLEPDRTSPGRATAGQDAADDPCPTLEEFTDALAGKQQLRWLAAGGTWSLEWS
jgi:hypothetical protein